MSTALGYPLYMNGQRLEEPVTISHVPSVSGTPDGLGRASTGMQPYVPYQMVPAPRRNQSMSGDIVNAVQHPMRGIMQAVKGLGADSDTGGFSPAAVAFGALLGIAIRAGAGYFVGKAVAPSRDSEGKYAAWGIVAGVFGGTIGLGIEAAIALNNKSRY